MNSKEGGKDPESDSKSDKKPALPDKIKQQLEEKGIQSEEDRENNRRIYYSYY